MTPGGGDQQDRPICPAPAVGATPEESVRAALASPCTCTHELGQHVTHRDHPDDPHPCGIDGCECSDFDPADAADGATRSDRLTELAEMRAAVVQRAAPAQNVVAKGRDADREREREIREQFAGAHKRLQEMGVERFDPPLSVPSTTPRRELTIAERVTLLVHTAPETAKPMEAVASAAKAWVECVADSPDVGAEAGADAVAAEQRFRQRLTELVILMAQPQAEPDTAAPDRDFATEERPEDAARRFAGQVVELEAALRATPLMRAARQLEHALGHAQFEARDVVAAAGLLLTDDRTRRNQSIEDGSLAAYIVSQLRERVSPPPDLGEGSCERVIADVLRHWVAS